MKDVPGALSPPPCRCDLTSWGFQLVSDYNNHEPWHDAGNVDKRNNNRDAENVDKRNNNHDVGNVDKSNNNHDNDVDLTKRQGSCWTMTLNNNK